MVQAYSADGVATLSVRNLMQGRIALTLLQIRIDAAEGMAAIAIPPPPSCMLPGSASTTLSKRSAAHLPPGPLPLSIAATAVPLDNPGRSMYREWAWLRRPTEIALIDEELAKMDALPECPAIAD